MVSFSTRFHTASNCFTFESWKEQQRNDLLWGAALEQAPPQFSKINWSIWLCLAEEFFVNHTGIQFVPQLNLSEYQFSPLTTQPLRILHINLENFRTNWDYYRWNKVVLASWNNKDFISEPKLLLPSETEGFWSTWLMSTLDLSHFLYTLPPGQLIVPG